MKLGRMMCVLFAVAALGGTAKAGLSAEGGRVFVADNGTIEVAIVELSPKGSGNYLIRVTGTRSELDGKVLPYKLEDDGGDDRYATQAHGRTFYYVWQYKRRYNGRWVLYAPGRHGDDVTLTFDEKKSKDLKAKDVVKQHEKQLSDKTIENFARFDRPAEEKRHNDTLTSRVDYIKKQCGLDIKPSIDWSTVSNDLLKEFSIGSYCESPLEAISDLCDKSAEGKKMLAFVKSYKCRFGDKQELVINKDGLGYTTSKDATNAQQKAREQLLTQVRVDGSSPPADGKKPDAPWGEGKSLGERRALEDTKACTDGKSHVVAIAPDAQMGGRLFYSDGKKTFAVGPTRGLLSPGWFFDPRFRNPNNNSDLRGYDLRNYSHVSLDSKTGKCELVCGTRKVELQTLDPATREKILLGTPVVPNPNDRVPHALGRDADGKYYYVDRGNTPETEKIFRLWVGMKGAMKPQKMINVVSDTSGEIFTTKNGQLKFILNAPGGAKEEPSQWIQGKKKIILKRVEIQDNLPVVYNELGIYLTTRLGTPCDDM